MQECPSDTHADSLPGAIGMYALAVGISHVGERLPEPVYALLSGLNAATVGYIALAAVQLARKVITDRLTRILLFLAGAAGMLYSALWYFPSLMFGAGVVTMIWDAGFLQCAGARIRTLFSAKTPSKTPVDLESSGNTGLGKSEKGQSMAADTDATRDSNPGVLQPLPEGVRRLSWQVGTAILVVFGASFVLVVKMRIVLKTPPRSAALFSNIYLAGTIIFGDGPVVIPLLREYVVSFGWVSPRDFLLGVAIIQSFPGPNVNFAVYLGALATAKTSAHSFTGALLGFIGIFVPGMIVVIAFMGVWSTLRSRTWLQSLFRGISAAAVGLIYTAVYRLWRVGLLSSAYTSGIPLSEGPLVGRRRRRQLRRRRLVPRQRALRHPLWRRHGPRLVCRRQGLKMFIRVLCTVLYCTVLYLVDRFVSRCRQVVPFRLYTYMPVNRCRPYGSISSS